MCVSRQSQEARCYVILCQRAWTPDQTTNLILLQILKPHNTYTTHRSWHIISRGCGCYVMDRRTSQSLGQNHPGKFGQQSAIYWNSRGLLCFFRNKTVLFFKIESWNFQHLFEKLNQLFRHFLFPYFVSIVWLSWNFVRVHEILFYSVFIFKS